jgi:Ca2+-binding RTX toxin-like protein
VAVSPAETAASADTAPPETTITSDSTTATVYAAGDIASGANQNDEATAAILRNHPEGTVITLGDLAYDSGSLSLFNTNYDPTWGTEKARTNPAPGNHEYVVGTTPQQGRGYFDYFGAVAHEENAGSYSYDLGSWHIVALNTGQCSGTLEADGSHPRCGPGDPMITWLHNDLAAHTNQCTLAYWHHPRFSSGQEHGNDFARTTAIWNELYTANADLVLNGHDHDYERFAPQNVSGAADSSRGIREFVVGTGGRSLPGFGTMRANSQVRSLTYGVLKLTLSDGSYDWQFIPVAGQSFTDSGSGQCHGAPGATDIVAPTVSGVAPTEGPTEVAATANAEATFSEAIDPNTISDTNGASTTFTLVKQNADGTTTPVEAKVSYNAATNKATLDPNADLDPSATYTATVKGGAMGVKDLAGNPLAEDKTWIFTTAAVLPPLPDIMAPTINLSTPPDGATYTLNEVINANYSCADEAGGSGLASCAGPANGSAIDTSSTGTKDFTVTATDIAGNTTSITHSYTVNGGTADTTAPTINLATPPEGGATYTLNQAVNAQYSCTDEIGGSGLASCAAPVAIGAAIHTSTMGTKDFTVTATDNAGNTASVTHSYTVKACTISGTSGNDSLKGTSRADVICGLGGNDTIQGLDGNDLLQGGEGGDTLVGGPGDDTQDGGLGTDTGSFSGTAAVVASLAAGTASGQGSDTLTAIENLTGSSANDTLTGDNGPNKLDGSGGNDTQSAGAGNDNVIGGKGADNLFGEDGDDTVNSKDSVKGNDSLDGGPGTDTKVTDATEKSIVNFP